MMCLRQAVKEGQEGSGAKFGTTAKASRASICVNVRSQSQVHARESELVLHSLVLKMYWLVCGFSSIHGVSCTYSN
jgi:hypothetical protein